MRPCRSLPPLVALVSLGSAACRPEPPARAIARYTQAIARNAADPSAHYQRGLAYLALDSTGTAGVDFQAAIRLRPDFAEAHYQLGRVLAPSFYDRVEARAEFDTALRLNPGLAEAYVARAGIRDWNGTTANMDSILADVRTALGLNPRLAAAYVFRGNLEAFRLGQLDSAVADYTTAIRVAPGDPEAYAARAGWYQGSRHKAPDYDRAIADYGA